MNMLEISAQKNTKECRNAPPKEIGFYSHLTSSLIPLQQSPPAGQINKI